MVRIQPRRERRLDGSPGQLNPGPSHVSPKDTTKPVSLGLDRFCRAISQPQCDIDKADDLDLAGGVHTRSRPRHDLLRSCCCGGERTSGHQPCPRSLRHSLGRSAAAQRLTSSGWWQRADRGRDRARPGCSRVQASLWRRDTADCRWSTVAARRPHGPVVAVDRWEGRR